MFFGIVVAVMSRPTGHRLALATLQAVLDRIEAGPKNSQTEYQIGVQIQKIYRKTQI